MKIKQGIESFFRIFSQNLNINMKKLYYVFFCILTSIFIYIWGCTPNLISNPDYPSSCIKGYITDLATHKPLPGVTVTTIPGSTSCISDTAGIYFLSGIPMGSSGTNLIVLFSRAKYVTDTISLFLNSNDTVSLNISLSPSNGIFIANDIDVKQFTDGYTLSCLDLSLLNSKREVDAFRDLDMLDSSGLGIKFRFRSSHIDPQNFSFITKIANSLGKFTKYQFDTLARIYDAGDTIQDSYFTKYNTEYFVDPLTENSVYPFYLYGRYLASQNLTKIFGLLYLKSTRIDNGLFVITVDVKVNKNGINYFIPDYK